MTASRHNSRETDTEKHATMTHTKRHTTAWITGAAILLAAAGWWAAQDVDLKGRVQNVDRPGLSLAKRMAEAEQEFRKEHKDGLYLTGYVFPSRNGINMGDRRTLESPYQVRIKSDEIRIRRTQKDADRDGFTVHTEMQKNGPAGIFLLHRLSGGKSLIVDTNLFDPDRSFFFEETPLYWLGEANSANESFAFLRARFESGGSHELQNSLIFVMSIHDSPDVLPFLKGTALGRHDTDIRKSAIFWIGNMKGPESFRALKDISSLVQETELRKHVVFAYSLNSEEDALQEMIRIARSDKDREVRKQAIFWLGQKASDEAVFLLKGVVEGSDEDDDLKKSAVFAISQLPKDRSVPLLISIAKSNQSAAVRKTAIFWLGQTGEEEALQFFEEILLKK